MKIEAKGYKKDGIRFLTADCPNGRICNVQGAGEGDNKINATAKANARLIAAAPQMLEALREFMGDFVSIVTAANHNDLATIIYVAKACQKEISELLKKVEGEV